MLLRGIFVSAGRQLAPGQRYDAKFAAQHRWIRSSVRFYSSKSTVVSQGIVEDHPDMRHSPNQPHSGLHSDPIKLIEAAMKDSEHLGTILCQN